MSYARQKVAVPLYDLQLYYQTAGKPLMQRVTIGLHDVMHGKLVASLLQDNPDLERVELWEILNYGHDQMVDWWPKTQPADTAAWQRTR